MCVMRGVMNLTLIKGQLQMEYDIAADQDAERHCHSVGLGAGPGDN